MILYDRYGPALYLQYVLTGSECLCVALLFVENFLTIRNQDEEWRLFSPEEARVAAMMMGEAVTDPAGSTPPFSFLSSQGAPGVYVQQPPGQRKSPTTVLQSTRPAATWIPGRRTTAQVGWPSTVIKLQDRRLCRHHRPRPSRPVNILLPNRKESKSQRTDGQGSCGTLCIFILSRQNMIIYPFKHM